MGNRADDMAGAPKPRGNPNPPKNQIIPEKLGYRIERQLDVIDMRGARFQVKVGEFATKLDGIIVDQEITGVEIGVIKSSVQSQTLWNWIRDLIVIILLVVGISFMVYRGFMLDGFMKQCQSESINVPQG